MQFRTPQEPKTRTPSGNPSPTDTDSSQSEPDQVTASSPRNIGASVNSMGMIDVLRINSDKVGRDIKGRLRVLLLKLMPSSKLSPMQRFRRDGFNSRIFSSVPGNEINEVLVFGGYKGESVGGWLDKNPRAKIHAYEPVHEYAAMLNDRFREANVIVHDFGVGKSSGSRTFSIMGDATSGHPGITEVSPIPSSTINVRFESVAVAGEDWPERVDVAEINIEGGEYELISALAEAKALRRLNHIFVQFHDVGKDTDSLVDEARNHLAQSHNQVWCYEMVWEYWRLTNPIQRHD